MSDQGQPAGWYHAEGDPPGTTRYWDGIQWQGGPQAAPVAQPGGNVGAMGGMGGTGQTLATPGLRMAGRLIDVLISFGIALVIGAGTIDFDSFGDTDTVVVEPSFALVAASAIIALAYDTLFTHFLGGTPGKLLLGMRVAEADNGMTPPSLVVAAKRAANRLLGFITGIGGIIALIIGIASLVMLFTDDRHQTVMDKIAGTVVVKK